MDVVKAEMSLELNSNIRSRFLMTAAGDGWLGTDKPVKLFYR